MTTEEFLMAAFANPAEDVCIWVPNPFRFETVGNLELGTEAQIASVNIIVDAIDMIAVLV